MFGIWTFDVPGSVGRGARGLRIGIAALAVAGAFAVAPARAEPYAVEFESMSPDTTDAESELTKLVCSGWHHGMPRTKIIALGPTVLPKLVEMLRSDDYEHCWSNVCVAIAAFGDTSYFDTLRAFVWDRFKGKIGRRSQMAVVTAQGNIAWLAAGSERAVDYLIRMTEPAAWRSLPWEFPEDGRERTARYMARKALNSLCYVDDPKARSFIDTLSVEHYCAVTRPPLATGLRTYARDDSTHLYFLRKASREIHSMGLRQWSLAQEERSH